MIKDEKDLAKESEKAESSENPAGNPTSQQPEGNLVKVASFELPKHMVELIGQDPYDFPIEIARSVAAEILGLRVHFVDLVDAINREIECPEELPERLTTVFRQRSTETPEDIVILKLWASHKFSLREIAYETDLRTDGSVRNTIERVCHHFRDSESLKYIRFPQCKERSLLSSTQLRAIHDLGISVRGISELPVIRLAGQLGSQLFDSVIITLSRDEDYCNQLSLYDLFTIQMIAPEAFEIIAKVLQNLKNLDYPKLNEDQRKVVDAYDVRNRIMLERVQKTGHAYMSPDEIALRNLIEEAMCSCL